MRPPFFLADAATRALRVLDPERAHRLTVEMLARGLGPKARRSGNPRLAIEVAGLEFPNPLGLAAGFDKNARAPDAMLDLGFGFVEVGAVTPRPQAGNARPRIFRLREDRAVINRYGFNNDGLEAIARRLAARPGRERGQHKTRREGDRLSGCAPSRAGRGIVGVNLGANKESADRIEDYVTGVRRLVGLVDFYTVNISSPNTPGLRALQDRTALMELLTRVLSARGALAKKAPVFLKIAPDLADSDKADIAECVRGARIDGLIVSNTTIARPPGLISPYANEPGGLSGAPLFAPSTALLGEFHQALGGAIPLIGVGGISSPRDAYEKILAGASLVQLYTALIYQGPGLVRRILEKLPEFLDADGFANLREAVGAGAA